MVQYQYNPNDQGFAGSPSQAAVREDHLMPDRDEAVTQILKNQAAIMRALICLLPEARNPEVMVALDRLIYETQLIIADRDEPPL